MALTEPIRLREWTAPDSSRKTGRLFTCGRPGRATVGTSYVTVGEHIIDLWVNGLPKAEVVHIVSLLGSKDNGKSEFGYYPFRSSKESGPKPTFQEWLDKRYGKRFVVVEFPTVDAQKIPREGLDAAACEASRLLEAGYTIIVIDSGGDTRSGQVCMAVRWKPMK
jgi:hypothetical protein